MPIPNGYTRIEANKLYENVEYYIDTTISYGALPVSNIRNYPYIGGYREEGSNYIAVYYDGGTREFGGDGGWFNITNGIVTGYPTLNINLDSSPEWLYVKTSNTPDLSKVKKVNITDKDGNEFSFDVGGGGGGSAETLTAETLSEVMALCTEDNLGKYVNARNIQGENDGYNRGRPMTFRICRPLISFTLSCDGYTQKRTCEEGMTWKDFEYSVYAQSRSSYMYVTSDNKVRHYYESTYAVIPKDFHIDGVTGDDVIIADTTYTGTKV